MIFLFALFAGVSYACAAHGLPAVSGILCGSGMLLTFWLGLSQGHARAYDQMGRPGWRPPLARPTPTRPDSRIVDEETD